MKNLSYIHAALALLFLVFTAQNAAALTCSARVGDFGGDYAAQVFANATTDACEYSPATGNPDSDGHYIASFDTQLQVLFYKDGAAFEPASKSLSCSGADSTTLYTGGISAFSLPMCILQRARFHIPTQMDRQFHIVLALIQN